MIPDGTLKFKCVKCEFKVFAITRKNSNECQCLSDALTWKTSGICDCGSTAAITYDGTNYKCATCSNATAYTGIRKVADSCNCVDNTILNWITSKGVCECKNSELIIVKSGKKYKCVACSSVYALSKKSIDECSCLDDMVWNKVNGKC